MYQQLDITLSRPNKDVNINIGARRSQVAISIATTNCLINGRTSYNVVMSSSNTKQLSLRANGITYILPTSISDLPGSVTYNKESDTAGSLTITTPSEDINLSIVAEPKPIT